MVALWKVVFSTGVSCLAAGSRMVTCSEEERRKRRRNCWDWGVTSLYIFSTESFCAVNPFSSPRRVCQKNVWLIGIPPKKGSSLRILPNSAVFFYMEDHATAFLFFQLGGQSKPGCPVVTSLKSPSLGSEGIGGDGLGMGTTEVLAYGCKWRPPNDS